MNNNKRKIILGSIIGVLVGTLVSVSYAFFTYTRTGTSNNQLVTGNIWMRYGETNTLTLENAMPRSGPVENKYFEFTIEGTNTTEDKDIWYDISLVHGTVPTNGNKTESNRIDDKYLRFRLVEVENNVENSTPLLDNKKYNDLTNRRIYVDKIGHGQTVNKTYRLYMWLDNSVGIGNTSDARYSISEWNDLFASIKVNVTGDFNEKEVPVDPTDESCFTTTVSNNEVTITGYDVNCGGTDVVIPNEISGVVVRSLGDESFYQKGLTSIILPDTIRTLGDRSLNSNSLTKIKISNNVVSIGNYAFQVNPIKKVDIDTNEIPTYIFAGMGIEELKLGNNVRIINAGAFVGNQLSGELIIPSTVTKILGNAFAANHISNVNIPTNIEEWGCKAFFNNENIEINNQSGIQCTE